MTRRTRHLAVGDNLEQLSGLSEGSVALIYLDPPFNSGRTYDLIDAKRDGAAGGRTAAFGDQWKWSATSQKELDGLGALVPASLADLVRTLVRSLGRRDLAGYITWIAPRIYQMHRVLDERGSIYLHCDTSASHYLRVLMDEIFGPANFRNEVIWRRTHAHSSSKRYGPVHDSILFYTKSTDYRWTPQYTNYPQDYLDRYYSAEDEGGRFQLITCTAPGDRIGTKAHYEWRGKLPPPGRHWAWKREKMEEFQAEGRLVYSGSGTPRLKRYADEAPGVQLQDVWSDMNRLDAHSDERVGFETQKPIALMKRIIEASTVAGDIVLDPFVGSGSTLVAAEQLGRSWIGIDRSLLAGSISLARVRGEINLSKVQVDGFPSELSEAHSLRRREPLAYGLWSTSMLATLAPRKGRTTSMVVGSGRVTLKRRRTQLVSWVPLKGRSTGDQIDHLELGRLSKVGFVVQADNNGTALAEGLRSRLQMPIHEVPLEQLVTVESRRSGVAQQVAALAS